MKTGVWEVEEGNRSQGEEKKSRRKKSLGFFFLAVCVSFNRQKSTTQRKWRRGKDCEYLPNVLKT